eukprot:Opistho-2@95564
MSLFSTPMFSVRSIFYKPRKGDERPLSVFYHSDEELRSIVAALDSFDGLRDPERCRGLIERLRVTQQALLNSIEQMMVEAGDRRACREYRLKFPDDVQDELRGFYGPLWFGAECLAGGSIIEGRPEISRSLAKLASPLCEVLNRLREVARAQALKNPGCYPPTLRQLLAEFDRLWTNFEFTYVRSFIPVKSTTDYDDQQDISVLFSEALSGLLHDGLIDQDMIDDYEPALMIALPRLAVAHLVSNGRYAVPTAEEVTRDKESETAASASGGGSNTRNGAPAAPRFTFLSASDSTAVERQQREVILQLEGGSGGSAAISQFMPLSRDRCCYVLQPFREEIARAKGLVSGLGDSDIVSLKVRLLGDAVDTEFEDPADADTPAKITEAFVLIAAIGDRIQGGDHARDVGHVLKTVFRMYEMQPNVQGATLLALGSSPPRMSQLLAHSDALAAELALAMREEAMAQEAAASSTEIESARDAIAHGGSARERAQTELPSSGSMSPPTRATRSQTSVALASKAPAWVPDASCRTCGECKRSFGAVVRRHHCRNCGQIFCAQCAHTFIEIPRYGYDRPVRVCNNCAVGLIEEAKAAQPASLRPSAVGSPVRSNPTQIRLTGTWAQ